MTAIAGLAQLAQNAGTIARFFSGGSRSGPGTPARAASEAAFYQDVYSHFARGKPAQTSQAYVQATQGCAGRRDQYSCNRLADIAQSAREAGDAAYRRGLITPVQSNLTSLPLQATAAPVSIIGQPVNAAAVQNQQLLLVLLLLLLRGGSTA